MTVSRWARRLLAATLLVLAGCATAPAGEPGAPLTVFAAASLTDAFTDLGDRFTAETGTPVQFNFAGSNQLANQIAQGAPADIFAAADEAQMAAAIETGRIDPGAPVPFATNRLAAIIAADQAATITAIGDLSRPGVLLVLAAPDVPAGHYARAFLDKAAADPAYGPSFRAGVLANVVSHEANVRAVLTKVALGEADAGIVYRSDLAGDDGARVVRLDIPDALNVSAVYPLAALNDSGRAAQAAAFVAYVLSPTGQEILARHGFTAVAP